MHTHTLLCGSQREACLARDRIAGEFRAQGRRWSVGDSRDGAQGQGSRFRRQPKPSASAGSACRKLLTHCCLLLHRQPPWPSAPSLPPCARTSCPTSLLTKCSSSLHLGPSTLYLIAQECSHCSDAEVQIRKNKKRIITLNSVFREKQS